MTIAVRLHAHSSRQGIHHRAYRQVGRLIFNTTVTFSLARAVSCLLQRIGDFAAQRGDPMAAQKNGWRTGVRQPLV
ncbi:hypothetical protein [Stieleria neptunia]|uniref:hypothetical protein n=1 Tax=Stieleria neptunia TaxID=2527979 RepID=UPI0018D227C2|nr:hypothetical protein [Stieleria neptunia]